MGADVAQALWVEIAKDMVRQRNPLKGESVPESDPFLRLVKVNQK